PSWPQWLSAGANDRVWPQLLRRHHLCQGFPCILWSEKDRCPKCHLPALTGHHKDHTLPQAWFLPHAGRCWYRKFPFPLYRSALDGLTVLCFVKYSPDWPVISPERNLTPQLPKLASLKMIFSLS